MRLSPWLALALLVGCDEEDPVLDAGVDAALEAEERGPMDATVWLPPDATADALASASSADGSSPDAASRPPGTVPEEPDLDGRRYLLQSAVGYQPLPDVQVLLGFEDRGAYWHSGCNRSFGDFAIEDGELVVPSVGSTLIYCEGRLVQEDWFNRFYMARPKITVSGDWLTLVQDGVTLDYLDRELADPDRPLVGTPWTIDAFRDPSAVTSYALPTQPELRFDTNGELHVDTACNDIAVKFVVSGTTVTLSDVSFTKQACNDELQARVDDHLGKLFRAPTLQFETDARALTLSSEPGFGIHAFTP